MRKVSRHLVPQQVFELCELCADISDSVAEKHKTESSLPPLVGMNFAYLSLVQCFELLDYYYDRWCSVEPWIVKRTGPELILDENEQRVAFIQKSTFIHTMSAFEAAAKMALVVPNCPLRLPAGRVYFRRIMEESYANDIIDADDLELWVFATELRNCIVHNNAIADRSLKFQLDENLILEMSSGQMTQSSPRKTTKLIRAILIAYSRWSDELLSNWALEP